MLWNLSIIGTWLCTLHTYGPLWYSITSTPNEVNISQLADKLSTAVPDIGPKCNIILECTQAHILRLKGWYILTNSSKLCVNLTGIGSVF